MAAARPFEKLDWYGLAGCECWSADSPPVLREVNGRCLAVADKNGGEITFTVGPLGKQIVIVRFDRPFNFQQEARHFLDDLPVDLTEPAALELGFARIDRGAQRRLS